MYRGRFQQGQEITLGLLIADSNGAPVAPDAVPTLRIYGSAGTLIMSGSVPIQDRFGQTGWFAYQQFLDQRFPADTYSAVYQWAVSSSNRAALDYFEVLGGGSKLGSIVAMDYYRRPQADFVVQNTFAGTLQKGRNPTV